MVVDEHEHPGNHLARLFRATTCPRKICCSTSSTAKLAPKTLSSNFGTSHCRSCSYRHELIVALLDNPPTGSTSWSDNFCDTRYTTPFDHTRTQR